MRVLAKEPRKEPWRHLPPIPQEDLQKGEEQYFAGDKRLFELTKIGWIKALLKWRGFQFIMILPNQIVFWIALIGGFIGVTGSNMGFFQFGSAITWFLWFAAVTTTMVFLGRVWCLICPFGGFAEWIQRLTLWGRVKRRLTLGKTWPAKLAIYGVIPSVMVFFFMTYWEEYDGVAGPGNPALTSDLIVLVFAMAILTFLVFDRRTFCRYLCPLSALIGITTQSSVISGFRAKDLNTCLSCDTKECMRGSATSYGCPWWESPASNATNMGCGLCTECIKGCPHDNVGLYLQAPFHNAHAAGKKRMDVAVAAAILWGMLLYEMWNAFPWYNGGPSTFGKNVGWDNYFNKLMHWPAYPNPLMFTALTFIVPVALLVIAWITAAVASSWKDWKKIFITQTYALIPVIGTGYIARQLPKFFHYIRDVGITATRVPAGWFGYGCPSNPQPTGPHGLVCPWLNNIPGFNVPLLPGGVNSGNWLASWFGIGHGAAFGIVQVEVLVSLVGMLGSLWVAYRIYGKDFVVNRIPQKGAGRILALTLLLVAFGGLYTAYLYVGMQATN